MATKGTEGLAEHAPSRVSVHPAAIRRSLAGLAVRIPGSDSALTLYQRDRRHGGGVLAAGLAFRVFLMLLPLALLLTAGLGFLAAGGSRSVADASKDAGITGILVGTISQTGGESRSGRWLLLLSGLVLLTYTMHGAYRALHTIHAVAWQELHARGRGSSEVLVSLTLVAFFVLGGAASVLVARLPALGIPIELLLAGAAGGAWLGVSWLLPHRDAPWQALLPGALACAIGIGVMHLVTAFYVPHKLTSTSQLYGTLGAAATLMSWLFLTCRLIVAAAVLNASLCDRGLVLGRPAGRKEPAGRTPGEG